MAYDIGPRIGIQGEAGFNKQESSKVIRPILSAGE